jgi:hypothetical protein
MKYLNKALMSFGSSLVVPIYYIIFTSITISTGMVIFLEFKFDPFVKSVVLFTLGLLLAFYGVYLINSQSSEDDSVEMALKETNPLIDVDDASDSPPEPASREELRRIFDTLDRHDRGRVEVRALESLAAALGEACKQHFVTCLAAKLESDASGHVSFEEFDRWYHDEYCPGLPEAPHDVQRARLLLFAQTLAGRLRIASSLLAAVGCQVRAPSPPGRRPC